MSTAQIIPEETTALALVDPTTQALSMGRAPQDVLTEARNAAQALVQVIEGKKKPVKFNGETYLEFEDWQTVARFWGATVQTRETRFVEFGDVQGFEATAEVFLVATGQVISRAESMCLNDEPNWNRKPLFQLRSMAQTRAAAKALRNVFAWVVVLAGYKPTPAEEMDGVFAERHEQPRQQAAKKETQATCQLCNREVKGLRVPKRGGGTEDVPPERIVEAGKKAYNGAIVCGHCQSDIKNKKRTPPSQPQTVEGESFVATKCEKDQDGSVIATGLVRSCSVTEGAKPRLIVKFDDDAEVYSWHTGDTRRLIEKYCLNKTCSFLCTDSKFGLAFSNVMTIDGQDADAVQLAGEIVP